MATQMIDGAWTETKALSEALMDFREALNAGTAKRFVVGTNQEIEEEKVSIAIDDDIADIKERLKMIEARSDQSMVAIPTLAEVCEYGTTTNEERTI